MKTAANPRIAETYPSWHSFTVFSEYEMMSTLGHDLRHLYDDVTDQSQPDDLLRLAMAIDAKRGDRGLDA